MLILFFQWWELTAMKYKTCPKNHTYWQKWKIRCTMAWQLISPTSTVLTNSVTSSFTWRVNTAITSCSEDQCPDQPMSRDDILPDLHHPLERSQCQMTALHRMVTSDDDFLWHLCQRHRHNELEISLGYPSALRSCILLAQWLPTLPPRRPRLSMRTPPTQAQHISSLKLMQLIVFHSCSTTALRPPM